MSHESRTSADSQRNEHIDYGPNVLDRGINAVTKPFRGAVGWLLAPRKGAVGLAPADTGSAIMPGMQDDPKPVTAAENYTNAA